jgi:hypothetical protein
MNAELYSFIEKLKGRTDLFNQTEEACRQFAILPILKRLGWDTEDMDEVCPEYSAGGGRVDYCLKLQDKERVFIEVKKAGTELDKENFQEQLLKYAFDKGIELAALTDGFTWRLFLPLSAGGWASRCFYVVDLRNQPTESTAEKLDTMLSRDSVESGKALERAKEVHESKERDRTIKDTIPKAWSQMLSEPDEFLIELLQEKVESLCGYRPEADVCSDFIEKRNSTQIHSISPVVLPVQQQSGVPIDVEGSSQVSKTTYRDSNVITFTNYRNVPGFEAMRITRFIFQGHSRNVSYWWEVLVNVCELIYLDKGVDFVNQILARYGRQRTGFSRSKNNLRLPRAIPGTGIYACVELSANGHIRRTLRIMELFGYVPSDLTIEIDLRPEDDRNIHENDYAHTTKPETGEIEFVFLGNKYYANSRRSASRRLCYELARLHPDKAKMLLNVQGRERKYFSINKMELKNPRLIPETDIYLNDILTTYEWQALEPKILRMFGYKQGDYKVIDG